MGGPREAGALLEVLEDTGINACKGLLAGGEAQGLSLARAPGTQGRWRAVAPLSASCPSIGSVTHNLMRGWGDAEKTTAPQKSVRYLISTVGGQEELGGREGHREQSGGAEELADDVGLVPVPDGRAKKKSLATMWPGAGAGLQRVLAAAPLWNNDRLLLLS